MPARCEHPDCDVSFTIRDTGAWLAITGYVEVRPTQGTSANAVHEKRYTGTGLCPPHAKLRKLRVIPGQTDIFGGTA